MEVRERIIELRKQRGMTTNKLATKAGLSQSFIRSVELGEKGITIENLELVCRALDISVKDFFSFADEKEKRISSEELLGIIEKLTPDQRNRLAEFLKFI